jgi:hypothetical protein
MEEEQEKRKKEEEMKKKEPMSIDSMTLKRHMKLLREQRKSHWWGPKRRR